MARKSFDDLLAEDATDEPITPPPPAPAPARVLRSQEGTPELPKSESSEQPPSSSTRAPRKKKQAKTAAPKWTTLERKDTLLWPDQVSGLTDLRRDLQRRKRAAGGGGERITENTLIRVAVAVLLENGSALTGKDETELRESLSFELRDSRTSEVQKS